LSSNLFLFLTKTFKFLKNVKTSVVGSTGSHQFRTVAPTTFKPYPDTINIMESHGPYFWNETFFEGDFLSVIGDSEGLHRWLERFPVHRRYPLHAKLATVRCVEMVHLLKEYLGDSLFIITSDHGQLLGEQDRYGHGVFLDDRLLRVPLFVKYPSSLKPLKDEGRFVSLASLPSIVRYCVYGDAVRLGEKYAFAESFGPQNNLYNMSRNATDTEKLNHAYYHKLKIYHPSGSTIINLDNETIEQSSGDLSELRIQEVMSLFA
jgi:hypothetical protein